MAVYINFIPVFPQKDEVLGLELTALLGFVSGAYLATSDTFLRYFLKRISSSQFEPF